MVVVALPDLNLQIGEVARRALNHLRDPGDKQLINDYPRVKKGGIGAKNTNKICPDSGNATKCVGVVGQGHHIKCNWKEKCNQSYSSRSQKEGVSVASEEDNFTTDWAGQSDLTRVTQGNLEKEKRAGDSGVSGVIDGRKVLQWRVR